MTFDRTETRANEGACRLPNSVTCCKCHLPLSGVAEYIVHTWKTATMPAMAFFYYHVACPELEGRS